MITGSKILVCTGFSSGSDLALKFAQALSTKAKGSLHLLHVCEYPMQLDWASNANLGNYLNEKFVFDLLNLSKEKLDQKKSAFGIKAETHISLGDPHQVIETLIKEKNIDVLVLGHKGKGETLFYLGGLAGKMIASSSIPLFVIKKEMSTNRVAGLVDSAEPMKRIISVTEEMASILSGPVEFVSLFGDLASHMRVGKFGFSSKILSLSEEERNEIVKTIRDIIKKELSPNSQAQIKVEITIEKKFSYHLNSILTGDNTDIAVMKRHQSDLLEKILIGSETRCMLEIFEGNLLIIPP